MAVVGTQLNAASSKLASFECLLIRVCAQKDVGGDDGIVGITGSITCLGLHKIMQKLDKIMPLTRDSVVADLGCALNK